jgi:hypothetical protein
MKKKPTLAILALISLGSLLRFGCMAVGSTGGGSGLESPDKKFLALASDLYNKKFWGGTHSYYEFTIQTAEGQRIQHLLMDEPPEGMISWRGEAGLIEWTADSSSVTYSFKGTKLTLRVTP